MIHTDQLASWIRPLVQRQKLITVLVVTSIITFMDFIIIFCGTRIAFRLSGFDS